jgi:uncharacterized protein (DUF305 family)
MSGMNHGSTGAPASGGTFNNADVTFAQQMIPHHQQAIEMAKLADGRAADPEVKDLATAIERAQDPEINTMKGWLKSWGKPLPSAPMGDMPGMNHGSGGSSGTAGMMSDQDMNDLKAVKGKDFDKKFAQLMIGHHQGAVAMVDLRCPGGRGRWCVGRSLGPAHTARFVRVGISWCPSRRPGLQGCRPESKNRAREVAAMTPPVRARSPCR